MAKFLTTSNISSYVSDIVRKAKERIVLLSPYFQLSDEFERRMRDADRNGKNLLIIYGKEDLDDDVKQVFADLDNLDLYFSEDLHAKCYFNEHELVLTSMNLYEYSEKNNHEMGVRATSEEEIYEDAVREVESIMSNAQPISLRQGNGSMLDTLFGGNGASRTKESSKNYFTNGGHCIRCGNGIDHDPERPFCRGCFKEWKQWENEEYEETYCHTCGAEHSTSMNKPQCKSCWSATDRNR